MTSHRLHITYDVEGWAHWRRATILQRYAPADFAVTIGPWQTLPDEVAAYDSVFLLPYGLCRDVREQLGSDGPLLICGFNVGALYRREKMAALQQHADHIVFNNRDNWNFHGRPAHSTWISNGVDLGMFHVREPLESRPPRVLSIGSEYHLKHNADLKGYLSILTPLIERLASLGIKADFRLVDSVKGPKMSVEEMIQWYNTGTIYVVASRCEGTPNPGLEAAACGAVVISTRVGNMPELIEPYVNGELVDRDVDAVYEAILRCQARYVEMAVAMQERIRSWDWLFRAGEYYGLFRWLIEERKARGAA